MSYCTIVTSGQHLYQTIVQFDKTIVFIDKAPEEITAVIEMRRAHILIVFIVFLIVGIFASISHTQKQ